MPLSLKDKGSRLQAFVRKNSDSTNNHNAPGSGSETLVESQADAPPATSKAPTRQELADAARLALPSNVRNGNSHRQQNGHVAGQPRLASPPLVIQTSPTPRQTRRDSGAQNALFSGSQLGDSFMNSGPSTPHNELEDTDEEATPNAKRQARRNDAHLQSTRGFSNGPTSAFRIEENLMMSIVPRNENRMLPSMMDGFRNDHVMMNTRNSQPYRPPNERPVPAIATQPKLPLREVRIQRLPNSSRNLTYETRKAPSPAPSTESSRWDARRESSENRRTAPAPETEDDLVSLSGQDQIAWRPDAERHSGPSRRMVAESPIPVNAVLPKKHRDKKRRRDSPDYDDNILSSMTYKDLKDEPFDLDPAKSSGQGGQDTLAKLPLKLEQYRQQGEKEQRHIFSTMTFDDWEASGDWFVDQFTDIMQRLRYARRNKRRMMQGFEDEAARREEAVRHRSETIDRKLTKMRQDGQRVVGDQSI
ncbi:hypothetical protein HIM_00494 [Hirsutella minnesotensis 3608]|nr:hypothetical protein HIM_00494 [Hirsutella minnesotensis 3608]